MGTSESTSNEETGNDDTTEVDNTDSELPTLKAWEEEHAGDDDMDGSSGTADPTKAFREAEISDEEVAKIEEERERRLDPANRPEGAEVDNTGDNKPDVAKDDPAED